MHKIVKITFTVLAIVVFVIKTEAQPLVLPTFKSYIETFLPTKTELDIFLNKNGVWGKYDSQLGYTLGNSLPLEGIDSSLNISTTQQGGYRTMYMYANRTCRINTYGNSFTQCQQVSDGETWQEYLAAHLGEPIRNFGVGGYGVYQSYIRLLREERTKNSAKNLIFYIWGDDHVRSLLRCRYMAIRQWNQKNELGMKFHGNFWTNIEIDLNNGNFIEKSNPLNTKKLLYKMADKEWMYQNLKDDIALQLLLFKNNEISDLNISAVIKLSTILKLEINWNDSLNLHKNVVRLLDEYAFAATKHILNKLKVYAKRNDKNLMIVLFDPYQVTNSLIETGTRYDSIIVNYLQSQKFNYFDMNVIHAEDFRRFNLNLRDYYARYLLGHYNPTGNHFFAYSLKDKVVKWLNPKPITYDNTNKKWIDFNGYLQGIK